MTNYEKELRIGLVLYGGVSLCMYIFGVVYEFLRLVRKEGTYLKLTHEAKVNPIIDVISGTSAGGINGIFLAKALASGASLDPLKSLWIEEGDLEKLIDISRNPIALLDSKYYADKLEEALNNVKPEKITEQTKSYELIDLFITATDLDGILKTFTGDTFSHPVTAKYYDTVFHFKMRPEIYQGDTAIDEKLLNEKRTGRNDFSGEYEKEKNRYLAKIAATTSAFPVAFAPVVYTTDEKARMKEVFKDNVCKGNISQNSVYGDGGMVNNRPFNYTVHTIFTRQADTAVDRKLFFVEPDPESIKLKFEEKDKGKNRLADKDIVDGFDSLTGMFKAGMYQSITTDLNNLTERNKRIKEVKTVIAELEKELENFISSADENFRDRLSHDPMYKAYRRYKIDLLSRKLEEEILNRVEDGNKEELQSFLNEKLLELKSESDMFLKTFDYPFRIRRIRYFINKINIFFKENKNLTNEIVTSLGKFKSRLYSIIEFYNHQVWKISTYGEKIYPANKQSAFTNVIKEYSEVLDDKYKNQTKSIIEELNYYIKTLPEDLNIQTKIPFVELFDYYEFIDMYVYPIITLADIGEADSIEVVRISPDLATHYQTGEDLISEKLAGEKLMHFSAFLKKSWRENDILLGRLDAAELIVKTLLPDNQLKSEELIDELCKDIVQKELKSILNRCKESVLNKLVNESESLKIQELLEEKYSLNIKETEEYFKNNYKVGSEGLQDIRKDYLVRVTGKMLRSFGFLLERIPVKTPKGISGILKRPVNFVSKVNNYIYHLLLAFTGELKSVFRNIAVFFILFIISLLAFDIIGIININNPVFWATAALIMIWLIFTEKIVKIVGSLGYVTFLVYYILKSGILNDILKIFG